LEKGAKEFQIMCLYTDFCFRNMRSNSGGLSAHAVQLGGQAGKINQSFCVIIVLGYENKGKSGKAIILISVSENNAV
jgi:hypothetical protein